jgi:carboxymethylenebutenolidase
MQDPLIPLSHVDEIETALQHAHVKHKIFRYDNAGHGFCCDQRADYRPEACHHAWNAVMELFTTL